MFQYIEAEDFPIQPIKIERSISKNSPKRTSELQATNTARRKRKLKRRSDEDYKTDEEDACTFVKVAADNLATKDDCTLFGQMVASQIKKLSQRNQAIAKNRIQNFIFELEMEEMDTASSNKSNTANPQEQNQISSQ